MLKSKEKEIMKLRVGSGLPNIQQNDLNNLKIEIYNKDAQLKICEVMDCQYREKYLLKKQLEQYKLQKQGLMQKLLTGKWRVK
jgi:type I restriction enzyme S subunit